MPKSNCRASTHAPDRSPKPVCSNMAKAMTPPDFPPNPRWPGGARIAVNFVINFEEGSELSHPAGDGVSETGLIESASTDAGNRRDLAAESMFEYGARVGW